MTCHRKPTGGSIVSATSDSGCTIRAALVLPGRPRCSRCLRATLPTLATPCAPAPDNRTQPLQFAVILVWPRHSRLLHNANSPADQRPDPDPACVDRPLVRCRTLVRGVEGN